MIDLKQPTKKLIEQIKQHCKENRTLFSVERAKNNRRLAGFTEDDVRAIDAATQQEITRNDPTDTRYVTSFNRTRGFFQRLLGRLMPAITHYQVLASSNEQDDKDAALSGAEMLESRTSVDSGRDFEEVCRVISYMFSGGPSYLRIEGNETDKEVDVGATLSLDVFYYPGITRLMDSPAIVLVERLTQQSIERRFPELAAQIEIKGVGDENGWNTLAQAKWPDEVNYEGIAGEIGKGMFQVNRLFILPCKAFPNGDQRAMLEGASEIEATWDEIGTADKEYPLEEIADVPMGPFYEDVGRMTIASRMQQVFDICISKMIDLTVNAGQALVNLPPGCGINEDQWTNKAVNFARAHPSMKPTVDTIDTLGNLPTMADIASRAMDEVHSQHQPTRGEIPGSRTSGRALESMIQQDVATDEPLMAMLRRSMARVGKRILMEGQRVWDDDYIYHVLGRNRRFQAKSFKTAQLKEGFSVRVLPDDGLPKNKVARMKMISDFQKQGLLADTIEARRAREAIGWSVDDDFYAAQPAEEQLIRLEEEQITQGTDVAVNFSDDHIFHRMRHRANNTERLAQGNTEEAMVKAAGQHDQMHMMKMREEMMAMMPPAPPGQEGAPQ